MSKDCLRCESMASELVEARRRLEDSEHAKAKAVRQAVDRNHDLERAEALLKRMKEARPGTLELDEVHRDTAEYFREKEEQK